MEIVEQKLNEIIRSRYNEANEVNYFLSEKKKYFIFINDLKNNKQLHNSLNWIMQMVNNGTSNPPFLQTIKKIKKA